ncbi:hypothetical protein MNU23_11680 [Pseudomonas aeruginosa]|nr:hypothetical protein [Pseudomonas aeruginosa]MCT2412361.1 hypothetical protein [Pseudomonas aeruginosa]
MLAAALLAAAVQESRLASAAAIRSAYLAAASRTLISSDRSISAHLVNVPLAILDHLIDGLLTSLLLGAFPCFEGSSGRLVLLLVPIPAGLPGRIHARATFVPSASSGQ